MALSKLRGWVRGPKENTVSWTAAYSTFELPTASWTATACPDAFGGAGVAGTRRFPFPLPAATTASVRGKKAKAARPLGTPRAQSKAGSDITPCLGLTMGPLSLRNFYLRSPVTNFKRMKMAANPARAILVGSGTIENSGTSSPVGSHVAPGAKPANWI
jgi:hypothetical protein